MLKDRGNKKWTSLMLVEHRKGLEEILKHEEDIDRPELDDQQLERLDCVIQDALRDNLLVEVIYYESRRLHRVKGSIKVNNTQIVVDGKRLSTQNIIDIKIL